MRHFVILPGLSSPVAYESAYRLLTEEAKARGWEPILQYYPGQTRDDGSVVGELSPESTLSQCAAVLKKLQGRGQPFRILGISYGCFVALATVENLSNLQGLDKVVLWGPIAHWRIWLRFGRGFRDEAVGKATTFVQDPRVFYSQMVPIEYLLTRVKCALNVCVGTRDKYVPPEFLHYLRSICSGAENGNVSFTIVEGCSHNVSAGEGENVRGYLEAVFS